MNVQLNIENREIAISKGRPELADPPPWAAGNVVQVKKFPFDDQTWTYGHNKVAMTLTKLVGLWLKFDDGHCELHISTTSIASQHDGNRADIFVKASIYLDDAIVEQHEDFDMPLRALCGTNDLHIHCNTPSTWYDVANGTKLDFRVPAWAPCWHG
jgi:hypothetical protein